MEDSILFPITMVVIFVSGVLGGGCNSWIVYVNLKDWRRGVHLSLPDQILSFMALINVVFQYVLCFDISCLTTGYYDKFQPIHLKVVSIFIFLVSCNYCFTACLSIYYYMRIVSFSGGLLLTLKMRISTLLPKLLVMSIVVSFTVALPSFWNIYPKIDGETIGNASYNYTVDIPSIVITSPYLITAILGCTVTLTLTFLPIGLTLCSLRRHMQRMNNIGSSSCPQTQAHITAIRTMVLLVTLHTLFIVTSLYIMIRTFIAVDFLTLFSWYFIIIYPNCQALVMITGNSKLKKATKGLSESGGVWCSELLASLSLVNKKSNV